jgi:hypothetical protein
VNDLDPPLRALFAAGAGDEPPLGLTPTSVLASGQAARRRRRSGYLAAGAGMSVVAVVGAVSAVSLAGGSPTSPASLAPASGACPPGRTAPPVPSPRGTGDPAIPVTPLPTSPPVPVTPLPTSPPVPVTPLPTSPPVPVTPLPTSPPVPVTPSASHSTDVPVTPLPTRPPRATDDPAVSPSPKPSRFAAVRLVPASPVSPEPCASSTAAPTPQVSPTVVRTPAAPEPAASRLLRLTAALKQSLFPPAGGSFVRSAAAPAGSSPLQFFYAGNGTGVPEYEARADVHDPLGRSSVEVRITMAYPPAPGDRTEPCQGLEECTASWTDRGDLVVVHRYTEGSVSALVAQAVRTDGTSVYVSVTDFSQSDQPSTRPTPPHPQRPTHPWTRAQLTTLTLTPTLHL